MTSSGGASNVAGPIGGASGDAGVEFRRAVAAYAVAHGLAGEPLGGFGVSLGLAIVVGVAVETDDYADDIRITFKDGRRAQVQAKRTLRFGGVLRSAASQWVEAARDGLKAERDTLVLVTGSASGPISALGELLARFKTDEPGRLTLGEEDLLARLDALLPGLTVEQLKMVRRCAVITVLPVEEEHSLPATVARTLLGRVVGDGPPAVSAWRDLVAHCGRVGRLRGGYSLEGWVRLLQDDGHRITGYGNPAREEASRLDALDGYRDQVRSRGSYVDLRPLGADAARIPMSEVDASVKCYPAGGDSRDTEPLHWSLLRRRRLLLTGLPGGGKSLSLSVAAAALVDAAGAPLPLMVSLRDVEQRDRSRGFGDRLLDAAVKDLPAAHRDLVRSELERGLETGSTALLLDSLDETHDRRGAVVAEIAELCDRIASVVPVLLATRDVAYAQASTLGWDDLRLQEPEKPEKAVRAVLTAVARARKIDDPHPWIDARTSWIAAAIQADRPLGETPLMPVLLALLAAERADGRFPATRAQILFAVIEAAVRRREAQRDNALSVATLGLPESASAVLNAFSLEARILADDGGQSSRADVLEGLQGALIRDWNLPTAAASSGAETIIHFWDELGIFVISGADETVSPRQELLLDIGDAVDAVKIPTPTDVTPWAKDRIRSKRIEPLILASALSETAAEALVAAACQSGDHELLIGAAMAMRQHARVSPSSRALLLDALAADAALADREGWSTFQTLIELGSDGNTYAGMNEIMLDYPRDHQTIGRAAIALRTAHSDDAHDHLLLEALKVRRLPPLPRRVQGASPTHPWATADGMHGQVVAEAATALVGRVEAATGLVVSLLEHASVNLHRRLLASLTNAGVADAATEVLARQTSGMFSAIAGLAAYDLEGPERLLQHLAQAAKPSKLLVAESSGLDELAALYKTLRLDGMGSWPKRDEFDAWLDFVDRVIQLGAFDPTRIAAEANVCRERMTDDEQDAFYALDIASEPRGLNAWSDIDDTEVAVTHLISALFMSKGIARLAAVALSEAPPDVAVPLLTPALPLLATSRDHHYHGGHALAVLEAEGPVTDWAQSDHAALRLVAADRLPATSDASIHPALKQLLTDRDRQVAERAVQRVGELDMPDVAALLTEVANATPLDWACTHCGRINAGADRSCDECHIVAPDAQDTARELLSDLGAGRSNA